MIIVLSRFKRVFIGKKQDVDPLRVQSLLIWNLGAAGLMMAGYLASLIAADSIYGEEYYSYRSIEWVNSAHCIISGFAFFTSIQGSIFFLVLISVDQYITLKYADTSGKKMEMNMAVYISLGAWFVAALYGIINALALRGDTDFHDLSRFCIGLPLFWRPGGLAVRGNEVNSFQLPFALVVILQNLVCFAVIMYCFTFVRSELILIEEKKLALELKDEQIQDKDGKEGIIEEKPPLEMVKVIEEPIKVISNHVMPELEETEEDDPPEEDDHTESETDEKAAKKKTSETRAGEEDTGGKASEDVSSAQSTTGDSETEEERIFFMAGSIKTMIFINCVIFTPIFTMAVLSHIGVPIPAQVYWWFVIVMLPIISAMNPCALFVFNLRVQKQPTSGYDG